MVKKQVKKQMIAGLDKSELVLLCFSKHDAQTLLRWEHDKEFEFRGQMFDVVETREQGDFIFYHCWLDHAETHLNKQLAQLVSGLWESHPSKREAQKRLMDFLDLLFCTTQTHWQISATPTHPDRVPTPACGRPPNRSAAPPNPPPEGN